MAAAGAAARLMAAAAVASVTGGMLILAISAEKQHVAQSVEQGDLHSRRYAPKASLPPPAKPRRRGALPFNQQQRSLKSEESFKGSIELWHITDWHLNLFHEERSDVRDMCRSSTSNAAQWPGLLGHFNCDPSAQLAKLAIEHVAQISQSPAFILLGGDSHGHVPPARDGRDAVIDSHRQTAALITSAFGDAVPVLPLVGNHDTWPYYTDDAEMRHELARIWSGRLSRQAAKAFAASGYYRETVASTPALSVVALDTNALALPHMVEEGRRQLNWLNSTFRRARRTGESVLLAGHIAPGASHVDFGSMASGGWSGGAWRAEAQARLYALLRQHAPVVAAALFGHLHTPSVRLLRPHESGGAADASRRRAIGETRASSDSHGAAAGSCQMPVSYLSPSLTPRNPTPHQPAVRRYTLSRRSGTAEGAPAPQGVLMSARDCAAFEVVDAEDHELVPFAHGRVARGAQLWRARSVRAQHNLTSLDSDSWSRVVSRLHDDAAFAVEMPPQRCADEVEAGYARCKAAVVCAMQELEDVPYYECLRSVEQNAVRPVAWRSAIKRQP